MTHIWFDRTMFRLHEHNKFELDIISLHGMKTYLPIVSLAAQEVTIITISLAYPTYITR